MNKSDSLSLSEVEVDVERSAGSARNQFAPISTKHHFPWLSKVSTVHLNLCGTDLSPRIELTSVNGPQFKTEVQKRTDEEGRVLEEQKQFVLFNNDHDKLLSVDFSRDKKSFHVLEPDSNIFIAFFTIDGPLQNNRIKIHNAVDNETYYAEQSVDDHSRIVTQIKSDKGEELAVIFQPHPKWTQFLVGNMVLNFTGDQRDGLNTREKAIVLGFLICLGLLGLDYWKKSSSGLFTFYVLSILFFAILIILIYCRFQEGLAQDKTETVNKPG